MHKFGPTQKKILIALLGGVALGMSSNPRQYWKTFRKIKKEWKRANSNNFGRTIRKLSEEKLIKEKFNPDGSIRFILTPQGKKQARVLNLIGESINFKKAKRWDGKWRVVSFDIPERSRSFRDILRSHLYDLKFKKLQHSVFVSPHPFEKPILELVTLYSATPYVRVITATTIDNEAVLKRHFFKLT